MIRNVTRYCNRNLPSEGLRDGKTAQSSFYEVSKVKTWDTFNRIYVNEILRRSVYTKLN